MVVVGRKLLLTKLESLAADLVSEHTVLTIELVKLFGVGLGLSFGLGGFEDDVRFLAS